MEDKKLKVLCLVDNYYPITGGVNTVVSSTAKELQNKINFSVCSVKYKGYKDDETYFKVFRSPGYYNCITHDGMAHPTKEFEKKILDEHFDILHCHTAGNLLDFALKIGKKQNIPVVSTIHNFYYPEVKSYVKIPFIAKAITKIFFKRTDRSDYVWAVSDFCAGQAKKYGLKKDPTIVRNAINFDMPTEEEIKAGIEKINNIHNLDNNTFVALFIARIIKGKNLDIVIDAINVLKEKNPEIKNFKVLVCGDGNYLQTAKERVKNLHLENYFIFAGMVTDRNLISNYYERANLVLFPSLIESIGLIQIESAAYSKPCLTIENMAQTENMIDGKNGLICKNDPAEFCEKLLFAYNNMEKIKEMGANANKTIFRSYKDEKTQDEIYKFYKDVYDDFKKRRAK